MSDQDERADPGIRTIIALLSGRKANEAIDEGERKDREANEGEDEREDRGTSAISQPPQHPAPVKQKKTADCARHRQRKDQDRQRSSAGLKFKNMAGTRKYRSRRHGAQHVDPTRTFCRLRHHLETNADRWPDHVQLSDLFWLIVPQFSDREQGSCCTMSVSGLGLGCEMAIYELSVETGGDQPSRSGLRTSTAHALR
jgi:hypothetical protein